MIKKLIVNNVSGLVVLFFVISCQPNDDHPITSADSGVKLTSNPPLQVIWGSRPLDKRIAQLVVSETDHPYILAQYVDGNMQIFDFDLDRTIEEIPQTPLTLTNGFNLEISGENALVFLGLDAQRGVALVYIPRLKLLERIDVGGLNNVAGFCLLENEKDIENSLGWWMHQADGSIIQKLGQIGVINNKLVATGYLVSEKNLNQEVCHNTVLNSAYWGRSSSNSFNFPSYGKIKLVEGVINNADTGVGVDISNGLSLRLPEFIDAMTVRRKGFAPTSPEGAIFVAGQTDHDGTSQILLINRKLN